VTQFDWDPALETGDSVIDEQHRSLFALANGLQASCEIDCDDADKLADAVYGLTDYVVQHFHDEEAFMQRCGYPGLGPHRALHEHLAAETLRIATRYFNGEDMLPDSLAPFVAEWLQEHIRREDMRMVAYAKGSKR
jgi:hemerythrin